jgi:hypothetical protein
MTGPITRVAQKAGRAEGRPVVMGVPRRPQALLLGCVLVLEPASDSQEHRSCYCRKQQQETQADGSAPARYSDADRPSHLLGQSHPGSPPLPRPVWASKHKNAPSKTSTNHIPGSVVEIVPSAVATRLVFSCIDPFYGQAGHAWYTARCPLVSFQERRVVPEQRHIPLAQRVRVEYHTAFADRWGAKFTTRRSVTA